MNIYNPYSACPKCGDANSPGLTTHVLTEFVHTHEGGYMKRACRRCGHGWREKPLDEQD